MNDSPMIVRPNPLPYPAPPYEPVDPSRAVRPMDATEHNMERFNRTGRGSGIVYQAARVRGPVTLSSVQTAMRLVARHHPFLSMRVAVDAGDRLWLERTDVEVPVTGIEIDDLDRWVDVVEADMQAGPVDTVRGPMFAVGVLGRNLGADAPDAERVLLLVGHHSACDAISCSAVMDELLSLLGGEPERSVRAMKVVRSPFVSDVPMSAELRREGLEELCRDVEGWSALDDADADKARHHGGLVERLERFEERIARSRDADASELPVLLLDLHRLAGPVLSWRPDRTWVYVEENPGTGIERIRRARTILRQARFDQSVTRGVIGGAKAHGLTVHGALGGAALFATALRHFRVTGEAPRSICLPVCSPVSLRGQFRPPLEPADLRMAVDVAMTPTDVAPDAGFWSVAAAFGHAVTREVRGLRVLSSWFKTEYRDRHAPTTGVPVTLVSNVGRSVVRTNYGPIRVLDVCCSMSTHGSFQIDMLFTTFRDRLSACFYFEEPTLSRRSLDRYVEDFSKVLQCVADGDDPTLRSFVEAT